jgi:hypothetical protein
MSTRPQPRSHSAQAVLYACVHIARQTALTSRLHRSRSVHDSGGKGDGAHTDVCTLPLIQRHAFARQVEKLDDQLRLASLFLARRTIPDSVPPSVSRSSSLYGWAAWLIGIHRGLDIRVSQQLLLHLDVGADGAQHRRVRMAECMPSDLPDAGASAAGRRCRRSMLSAHRGLPLSPAMLRRDS